MTLLPVAAVVIGVLLVCASAVWEVRPHLTGSPPAPMLDLHVYQKAGVDVLSGRDVYDDYDDAADGAWFLYTPWAAVVAVALAPIPHPVLVVVWTLLSAAVLLWLVRVGFAASLGRVRPEYRVAAALVITAAVIRLQPVSEHLGLGQVNLALAALCLADFVPRPRWLAWLPRGVLVGIATALKLTPAVFVVFFLLTGRRRAALSAVATALACTVVGFAVLPHESIAYWGGLVVDPARLGYPEYTSNQGLYGMLLHATGSQSTAMKLLWLAAAAVVGTLSMRRAMRAARCGLEIHGVVTVGLLGALLSPLAWMNHFVWAVPAVGLALGDLRSRTRVVLTACVVAVLCTRVPWRWGDVPAPGLAGALVGNLYGLAFVALVFLVPVSGRVGRDAGAQARWRARRVRRAGAAPAS